MSSGKKQHGYTLLSALFMVAAIGAMLAAAAPLWSHERQRERERELAWIGAQFVQAIGLYYHRTPGSVKRYPEKLEDLLEDRRFVSLQRYLRKVYADPFTGKPDWALVPAPGGGIMGVRSVSEGKPIRAVANVTTYADWSFVYEPPTPPPTSPAATGSSDPAQPRATTPSARPAGAREPR